MAARPSRQLEEGDRPVLRLVDGPTPVDAWVAAMRRGELGRAWEIADEILARNVASGPCWDRPRHEQWVWDGRPLVGQRVLVRCYHGLGDTIQFARFLRQVSRLARELIVWAQPTLIPLLEMLPDAGQLIPLHDGDPGVDYEVDIEIMELPHALRTDLADLPRVVPYLHVPAAPRLSEKLSVGVVSQSGDWDSSRDVPPEMVATLAEIPDVELYSLQLGDTLPGATDVSTPDVLETAARVRALDLVVSVDTMMAHLAGALAMPTWTLLAEQADWRWMEGRDDSPWYPTMRLYRQGGSVGWREVFERVARDLQSLARQRRDRAGARD